MKALAFVIDLARLSTVPILALGGIAAYAALQLDALPDPRPQPTPFRVPQRSMPFGAGESADAIGESEIDAAMIRL